MAISTWAKGEREFQPSTIGILRAKTLIHGQVNITKLRHHGFNPQDCREIMHGVGHRDHGVDKEECIRWDIRATVMRDRLREDHDSYRHSECEL